jgi:hypothetical protein
MAPVFISDLAEPGKLFSDFGTFSGGRSVGVTPADFVAFGSGTEFALFALGRSLESAAAAHFFKDTLGIQFGFEAFESTVNGLAFLHNHSTHAILVGWFGWFRLFCRGAGNAGCIPACQGGT